MASPTPFKKGDEVVHRGEHFKVWQVLEASWGTDAYLYHITSPWSATRWFIRHTELKAAE